MPISLFAFMRIVPLPLDGLGRTAVRPYSALSVKSVELVRQSLVRRRIRCRLQWLSRLLLRRGCGGEE